VASTFVEDGQILWKKLTTTIFGGAYLAVATGVTNLIVDSFETVGGLYSALGGFLAAVVTLLLGGPAAGLDASFAELQSWVTTAGPLSFAFAIASVLAITYVGSWVVNNVK